MNGRRPKLRRILSDPSVTVIVVEHRDRLARFGTEALDAALAAAGRRVLVADPGETGDDLVRDMIEVLTGMCARLYGRRGARNRALRAVTAARNASGRRGGLNDVAGLSVRPGPVPGAGKAAGLALRGGAQGVQRGAGAGAALPGPA